MSAGRRRLTTGLFAYLRRFTDEGQAEREEDLQQVPDHSPAWSGDGDLLRSAAQAAARLAVSPASTTASNAHRDPRAARRADPPEEAGATSAEVEAVRRTSRRKGVARDGTPSGRRPAAREAARSRAYLHLWHWQDSRYRDAERDRDQRRHPRSLGQRRPAGQAEGLDRGELQGRR